MITNIKLYKLIYEKLITKDEKLIDTLRKMSSDPIAKALITLKEIPDDSKLRYELFDVSNNGLIDASTANGNHSVEINPGKFVSLLKPYLNKDFKDYEIENFVNTFKRLTKDSKINTTDFTCKIVEGNDIYKYYQLNVCAETTWKGPLYTSCMKNSSKDILELYTLNNTNIKMIVLLDNDNKLRGRALLFKLDSNKLFLEKIYSITNDDSIHIYNYYINELKGEYNNEDGNIPNDETVSLYYSPFDLTKVPYLDTFRCWDADTNVLCIDETDIENGLILNSADGDATPIGNVIVLGSDINTRGFCYAKDAVDLWNNDKDKKENCIVLKNGEYAHEDDCVKDYENDYILVKDSIELSSKFYKRYTNSYALKSDTVETHDGEVILERDSVKLDKWTYAHDDECIEDRNGNYILNDEAVEVIEGGYMKKDDVYELSNDEYSINPEE